MAAKATWPNLKPRFIKVSGMSLCRAAYSPKHALPFMAETILSDPLHILYPQTKQRYDTRSQETLWWNVTSNTLPNTKRVLRSWINRRMRRAVVEALENYGLDAEGRPVAGNVKGRTQGLQGTLIIHALPSVIAAKFVDVKLQMELLVKELVRYRN